MLQEDSATELCHSRNTEKIVGSYCSTLPIVFRATFSHCKIHILCPFLHNPIVPGLTCLRLETIVERHYQELSFLLNFRQRKIQSDQILSQCSFRMPNFPIHPKTILEKIPKEQAKLLMQNKKWRILYKNPPHKKYYLYFLCKLWHNYFG